MATIYRTYFHVIFSSTAFFWPNNYMQLKVIFSSCLLDKFQASLNISKKINHCWNLLQTIPNFKIRMMCINPNTLQLKSALVLLTEYTSLATTHFYEQLLLSKILLHLNKLHFTSYKIGIFLIFHSNFHLTSWNLESGNGAINNNLFPSFLLLRIW